MRPVPFSVCLAVIVLGAPAFAADATPEAGRYSMTPAANGFLRLDTRTGAVSLCVVNGATNGVECRAAADDRAALGDEIDRLTKKNAELEARLAGGQKAAPLDSLPSREEMGKAFDYAEEFMRRMMRLMREEDRPGRDHI